MIYIYFTYLYLAYTLHFICHLQKCQNKYIKNKTFICTRDIFWYLPNFRRRNKITKSVKTINLKTD